MDAMTYTKTDGKIDFEKLLDRLAKGVIGITAALTLAFGAAAVLPETAHADQAKLVAELNAGKTAIDVKDLGQYLYSGTGESFCQWVVNIPGVNPCISRNSQMAYSSTGGQKQVVSFLPRYDYPDQIASRTSRYWAEVNRIAGEAKGQPNEYEQLHYAYNCLLARADYCWSATGLDNLPPDQRGEYDRHSTAASALLDGSTVCSGYAAALKDIYRAMGYESWACSSTDHAWTCIRLGDGQVFSCDPTKDDVHPSHPNFMVNVNTGALWRPTYNTPAPAPQAPVAASNNKTAPAPAATANKPAETATQLPNIPAASDTKQEIPERVAIKAGKVPVYNDEMTPANESIYSPIVKGFYTAYQYESATTLYAPATVLPSIEGKPNIEIAK